MDRPTRGGYPSTTQVPGGPAAARPPSLVLQGLVTKINFIFNCTCLSGGNYREGGASLRLDPARVKDLRNVKFLKCSKQGGDISFGR